MDDPLAADEVTARLSRIGLAEARSRASLERRLDHKYIVSWQDVEALVAALADSHSVLEIDGLRSFAYRTEYYDSASLVSYRAHVQNRRRRFKARVREYLDSGYSRVEVKTKGRRGETVKRWTDEPVEIQEFAAQALAEAYGHSIEEALDLSLVTSYRRITLVARESAERVTIDYELHFAPTVGDRARASLLPGYAIVESKSARANGQADITLRTLKARPVKVSKYVIGLALLGDRIPNDLRSIARSYFSAVAAAPRRRGRTAPHSNP